MLKTITNIFLGVLLSLPLFSQSVVLERSAELMDELYTINGTAFLEELDNGTLQLRLSDDFSTPAGPDVRIILNNSISGSGGVEVVNLSDIGHFNGALTVEVAAGVNIDDYQFIVFFCVQFNQLWASGEWSDSAPPGGGFVCEDSDVTLDNGQAVIDICPTDGIPDVFTFINTLNLPATTNYAYLLTDENEILEEVITGDNFNFEGSDTDEQRIYGIHYDGDLQAVIGSVRTATSATGCFTHSSNLEYIEISKNACPSFDCLISNTFTTSGATAVDICPSDGTPDFVTLLNNINEDPGEHYAYLVTDMNEILQEVLFTSTFNFEGSTEEEQRVYGVHFDGDLDPAFGAPRSQTTASGCFTHSNDNNFLTITKGACPPDFVCEDSNVSSTDGNSIDICPTDGASNTIEFTNSIQAEVGEHYAYLLTDVNQIVEEVILTDSYDFENSGESTQRVYGIHFDGDLLPQIGENRTNTTATGCFEHSSNGNFVTVTKDACPPDFVCEDSNVTSTDGNSIDICAIDGVSNNIEFTNSIQAEVGEHYAYLLTDVNEIVEEVILTNSYDFESSGESTQRVYGIHFDGDLLPQIGENRSNTTATGCFEHSSDANFVTVTKDACPPDFVCFTTSVSSADSESSIDICPSDDQDDSITFTNDLSIEAGLHYAYLITDANENVVAFTQSDTYDFEGSSDQEERVYGIHFDGDLNVAIGENRMQSSASECFEHSSSDVFLTITKNACIPPFECLESSVATTDWVSEVDLCTSDGEDDLVELRNTLMVEDPEHYAYLITDDNEIVTAFTTESEYNFEGEGDDTQRVYGIHFDGDLDVVIGENRMESSASECFEHSSSDLFLTITKNACPPPFECLESSVATTNWVSEVDICTSDGEDDLIELRNTLMLEDPEHYAYLITDDNEIVTAFTTESEYNFEGEGDDTQRVYGIHFDGDLDVVIGANRMESSASECFEHSSSDLFLTITKNACPPAYECMESLTATTDWATSVEICPTDGEDDLLELRNNIMVDPGANYAYLLTDANQIVQEVIFDNFYNFEGSPLIEQRIYGINYDGELDVRLGEDRLETTSSECFIHSGDNLFLTINKTGCIFDFECVESLTATTAWVTNIDICANDGVPDEILIQNNINTPGGENYAFLLTDTSEVVLEVFFDSIYNFEGLGAQEYRVYGVSYSGQLSPAIGEVRQNTTASDCYIHSGGNLFITVNTTATCIVSTSDVNPNDQVTLYPNPSQGRIHVDHALDFEYTSAAIFNMNGVKVKNVSDIRSIEIDNPGIYILQISTENEKINKRFVVIQ